MGNSISNVAKEVVHSTTEFLSTGAPASLIAATALYGFVLMSAARSKAFREAKTVTTKENKQGKMDVFFLIVTSVSWLGSITLPVVQWATAAVKLPGDYIMCKGQVLMGTALSTAGIYLIWRSHEDLGKNWSVTLEVRQDHKLVTSGIYKKIRHPMYTGFTLYYLGLLCTTPNRIVALSPIVWGTALVIHRLGQEEAMMVGEFGEEYEVYRKKTWSLMPYVY